MSSTRVRASRLAAAVSLALFANGMLAATITVDSADDSPDSTSCNLRNALEAINAGSTLSVPACSAAVSGDPFGSNDTIVLDSLPTITLTQGALSVTASAVTINGSATPALPAAPTPAGPYQTIDAGGASRVLSIADGVTVTANGLTLTGGQSADNGGGVLVGNGATASFANCSISGNAATADGGAIYASASSTLTLIDSTVSGNTSAAGAALFANDSTVTVTNTLIAYNAATAAGGGIHATAGALTLDYATVYDNSAQSYSGGVDVLNGAFTITHSSITRNNGRYSGGMRLDGASGTITTSTIDGNTATCGFGCAGAILVSNSTLAVSDSTISGNLASGHATYVAGGVNVSGGSATFANSTISGNIGVGATAASGAFALEHVGFDSSLTLVNSTITDNTAAAFYGTAVGGVQLGLGQFSPPPPGSSTLDARNTIIAGNTPANADIGYDAFSTSLAVAYSLLGSAQNISAFNDPADHNVFSDAPGLGPLQDNGGPTWTHALLPGSPAVRAGSIALAVFDGQALDFDQRGPGYFRSFGGTVDIGAFEDQQEDLLFASGFESSP